MKLWLLLLTAGHIGGAAGPLPYDMVECRSRAAEMAQELEVKGAAAVRAGRLDEAPDFTFVCVSRERRPDLGESFP